MKHQTVKTKSAIVKYFRRKEYGQEFVFAVGLCRAYVPDGYKTYPTNTSTAKKIYLKNFQQEIPGRLKRLKEYFEYEFGLN